MDRKIALAGLFLGLFLFQQNAFAMFVQATPKPDLGTAITLDDFAKATEGEYEITEANSKPSGKDAAVVSDKDMVSLSMPYCRSDKDPCVPGYIDLLRDPPDVSKVFRKDNKDGSVLYTIQQKDGLDTYTYEWVQPAKATDPILFRWYGFVYDNDPPFTLVYKLKKKPKKP